MAKRKNSNKKNMSRKMKNLLMICFVVLLLGTSVFTVYQASKVKNNSEMGMVEGDGNDSSVIPVQGGYGYSDPPEKPPAMPEGEMPGEVTELVDGMAPASDENTDNSATNNVVSEDMPPLPEGEVVTEDGPPELPEGEEITEDGPPALPDEENGDVPSDTSLLNNINFYYILIGIQGLLISLIVVYLVMSKFNEKEFNDTLDFKEKKIIYILSVILVTICLFSVEKYVVEVLRDNNSKDVPMEMDFGSLDTSNVSYNSSKELSDGEEISSGEYVSTSKDEVALLINGDYDADISNITISKSGNTDDYDIAGLYGYNSGILAKSGANLTLKNLNITTASSSSNGVFSLGDPALENPTTVNISDSTITASKYSSGGIIVTNGGVINASNLTIKTSGMSSAAIRSDHGGGIINVDGGTYTTSGAGSPAIYSVGKITVENAKLNTESSEGIVIESENSITINNCDLVCNNTKLAGLSTTYKGIFIYRSFTSRSDSKASFVAKNNTITNNKGDMFYVTNVATEIKLTNNTIVNNDSTGNFLNISSALWGTEGENGGNVSLILNKQVINGNIVVDDISSLDMTMKKNSSFEGIINGNNESQDVNLTLDKTSKIKLTGDSYISKLDNSVKNNSNIDFNGYKLYVNGKSIN